MVGVGGSNPLATTNFPNSYCSENHLIIDIIEILVFKLQGGNMKLESIALHQGYKSEETTKAAAVPIYQTTAYTFDDTQHGADLFDLKVPGNIYTRIMNPTTDVLEQRVTAMEGGIGALALASGMAAITYAINVFVLQVTIL